MHPVSAHLIGGVGIRTAARAVVSVIAMLGFAVFSAGAETVTLEAARDATLIEDPAGAFANGSGPSLFAGRNNQAMGSIRRSLVLFDVASALPREAIVEEVALTLHLSPSNPVPSRVRLHRVLADWGEGASSASGGGGAPSGPGDATWIHTFWDTEEWAHPGGHFVGRSSAELVTGDPGVHTWERTPQLAADVRLWVSAPSRNFGWILIGDESAPQTAKSFSSREDSDPMLRPVLEITYRLPGRPTDP